MARIHAFCLAAGLLPAIPAVVCAQGEQRVIRGTVTDTVGAVVPYVNVRIGRVTDDSGRFSVALNDRKGRKVELRRIGYLPTDIQLPPGGDTTLSVALIPTPQLLSPAVVKVKEQMVKLERRGFYRRMADREKGINSGHFITAEDIEKRNFPRRFTILLEEIPSVRVRGAVPTGLGGCIMTTYLYGARLLGGGLDDLIGTSSVAGVEVYPRGNGAPPEYQALNGSCGVILIWTR